MDEAHRQGFDSGGLIFRRNPDGSVTVYAPEAGEVTYSAQRWASIVAGVSAAGEGHVAYRSAYRFHTSEEPPPSPPLDAADLLKR